MNPEDDKFLDNLDRKFHRPDDPDKVPEVQMDDGEAAHLQRLQFDASREISVVRVALLKDGTLFHDFGGVTSATLYGIAHRLMQLGKEMDDEDNNDD